MHDSKPVIIRKKGRKPSIFGKSKIPEYGAFMQKAFFPGFLAGTFAAPFMFGISVVSNDPTILMDKDFLIGTAFAFTIGLILSGIASAICMALLVTPMTKMLRIFASFIDQHQFTLLLFGLQLAVYLGLAGIITDFEFVNSYDKSEGLIVYFTWFGSAFVGTYFYCRKLYQQIGEKPKGDVMLKTEIDPTISSSAKKLDFYG